MRRLLPFLALPLLAACNQVYTRQPLISEAHEGGDPEFRPGLWSITGYNEDCKADLRKPLRDWPDCAVGLEFRRGQLFLVSGHQRLFAQTLRFVAETQEGGAPILVQGHWQTAVLADPRAPEPKDTDNPFYGWTYYAVTPGTRADQSGRMMEATMTVALCGPLPAAQPNRAPPKVTARPFSGLTVVRDACQAKDLDAVRRALIISTGLEEPHLLKWVRDDP